MEEKELKNWEEIVDLYSNLLKSGEEYFFRGQAESEWKLNSTLRRKWEGLKSSSLLSLSIDLISFINNKQSKIEDSITILSEMQHNGTPTPLIDFTSDFFNALWFAFSDKDYKDDKDHVGNFTSLFLLKRGNKNIEYKLGTNNEKMQDKNIYSCPNQIKRGISQKSYFIVDNREDLLEEYEIEKYIIPRSLETKILSNLEQMNVNAENIYPDNNGLYLSFNLNSSESYFYKGLGFANDRSWDKSIKNFENAIRIKPSCSATHNNLGAALMENKDLTKAKKHFEKAIKIDPNSEEAYSNLGSWWMINKDFREAQKPLKKAIKINPNNAKEYFNLGVCKKNNKDVDGGIKYLEKATKLDPNNAMYHFNLGRLFDQKKYWDRAYASFQKATKLDPRLKHPYKNF